MKGRLRFDLIRCNAESLRYGRALENTLARDVLTLTEVLELALPTCDHEVEDEDDPPGMMRTCPSFATWASDSMSYGPGDEPSNFCDDHAEEHRADHPDLEELPYAAKLRKLYEGS